MHTYPGPPPDSTALSKEKEHLETKAKAPFPS